MMRTSAYRQIVLVVLAMASSIGISFYSNIEKSFILRSSEAQSPLSSSPQQLDDQDVVVPAHSGGNFSSSNSSITNLPVGVPSRVWHYDYLPFQCTTPAEPTWKESATQRRTARQGFLYARPTKVGSSTSSGVAIHLAQLFRYQPTNQMCKVRFDHGDATRFLYNTRVRNESFLFAFVRDPTDRAISEFFHIKVSRGGVSPTDANFLNFLKSKSGTYMLSVLRLSSRPRVPAKENHKEVIKEILDGYDFIGVTERMDESLVALKMIMELELKDVLYLSAKRSGGYDDGFYNGNKCTFITPRFVSKGVQDFIDSPYWKAKVRSDKLLHEAANASLDRTIEALGRSAFEQNLADFKRLRQKAVEICLPTTIWPCDENGVRHHDDENSCLRGDSGCGHECLYNNVTLDDDDDDDDDDGAVPPPKVKIMEDNFL